MGDLRNGVSTAGNNLVAALALPDTDSLALDGVLSAEGADVAGVLGDFHLLHLLTQGGTVSVVECWLESVWLREFSLSVVYLEVTVVGANWASHTWYHIYR